MFIFLILLYFIANTSARLLVRVFSKHTNLNSYTANLLLAVPTYLGMLVFGLATLEGSLFEGFTPLLLLMILLVSIILVFMSKLTLKAQKHLETAHYMVLRQVSVPASVLISTVFINESLNFLQVIGMIVILSGSYLVATSGGKKHIKHIDRYEIMAIIYGLFLGLFVVASRYFQLQTSLAAMLIIGGAIEMIPSAVFAYMEPSQKISLYEYKLAILIGLASAVHIITFWLAVNNSSNVALVSSIGSFRIVTIFIGSYLILKEKSDLKLKLTGTFIALIGLLLI